MKKLNLISSVLLAIALAFIGTSAALAAWGGAVNARDRADGGWIGNDDPDNVRRPHGPDSVWQDLSLAEWDEPSHDWVYDRWNRWGQAATALFNAEWQVKGLGTQLRIADQFYYNYTGVANWNYPYSKVPENENPLEELIQGYTEVDGEINNPNTIIGGYNYFIDYRFDSEKIAVAGSPTFNSDLEWCDNFFLSCEPIDRTGMMRKVALVQ
jgi:hypothetical protein